MDLREKIARIIALIQLDPDDPVEMVAAWLDPHECDQIAGKILNLPEIKEALEAVKAWQDVRLLGTGFMKDGKRLDPSEVYLKKPEPGPNEIYSHGVGATKPSQT